MCCFSIHFSELPVDYTDMITDILAELSNHNER